MTIRRCLISLLFLGTVLSLSSQVFAQWNCDCKTATLVSITNSGDCSTTPERSVIYNFCDENQAALEAEGDCGLVICERCSSEHSLGKLADALPRARREVRDIL